MQLFCYCTCKYIIICYFTALDSADIGTGVIIGIVLAGSILVATVFYIVIIVVAAIYKLKRPLKGKLVNKGLLHMLDNA